MMVDHTNFDHGEWAQCHLGKSLSPFSLRVFDILGIAYHGIYNAPVCWKTIDTRDDEYCSAVHLSVRGDELATYDDDPLTDLVFLCHEARMRFSIRPCGPQHFRFSFVQRNEGGSLSEGHPNLAEAMSEFHRTLPRDHRIIYRPEPTEVAA